MNLAVLAMRLATLTHASLNVRVVAALLRYRCERAMLLTPKADLRLVDPSRCSGQPALVSPT